MADTTNQFTKRPRRKREPGKSVTVSPETRKMYEAEIEARAERERTYLRHLPPREPK